MSHLSVTAFIRTMEDCTVLLNKYRRLIADIFFMLFVFWVAFLLMPQMMAQPWMNVPKLIVVEQVCEGDVGEENN